MTIPSVIVPTTPPQVSATITLSNRSLVAKVASEAVAGAAENVNGSPSADNRRYSSAPVASKDEQAELIRKQKAKLERHFRRSTTAVSYEDIKSAEATIKGRRESRIKLIFSFFEYLKLCLKTMLKPT